MKQYDVFISYSRKDSNAIGPFVSCLEKSGFKIWIDKDGIESGEAFKEVIVNAIESSSVLLFFSSENSNQSKWTTKEIGIATQLRTPIIPVKLDHSAFSKEILFDLVNTDYIDYTDKRYHEASMAKLLSSVSKLCSKPLADIDAPTPKQKNRIIGKKVVLIAVSLVLIAIAVGITTCLFLRKDNMPTALAPEQKNNADRKLEISAGDENIILYYVKPGTFWMGAQSVDESCLNYNADAAMEEGPVHQVSLDGFYISETVVTQGLWMAVMGSANEKWTKELGLGLNFPAYHVTFTEAQIFIAKLNAMTGHQFRLPTEAEWEWAARGAQEKSYVYSGSNNIDLVAHYVNDKSPTPKKLHEVKQKQANELKLYDMSGNVWEWCSDFWADAYPADSVHNPQGPQSGLEHVNRGGAFESLERRCRTSARRSRPTEYSSVHLGFRIAMGL